MKILFYTFLLSFGALWSFAAKAQEQTTAVGPMQGRTFVYGQDVHLQHPISIDPADSRPLDEILTQQFQGTGISFRITERHVLLFSTREPAPRCTIYGYVVDATSGETLIGANLYLPSLGQGTISNAYGHFSLSLPQGDVVLRTSYVGYAIDQRILHLTSDTLLTLRLRPDGQLSEVVLESDRPETGTSSTRPSARTIDVSHIKATPALLGEADVLKTLQQLPGVQSGFTGQSGLSVRGGDLDQNLFLLDGVQLYNPDHVLGFFSSFMPDAVKHVNFFSGGFSSRYGGRLSSVVDVRTREGDMQHYHGNFSIGLLSSHLLLEGPLWQDRTSFIVSARRSYIDWLVKPIFLLGDENLDIDVYFYDFNAKVNHRFSDQDRLYLTFYSGTDRMAMGQDYTTHPYYLSEQGMETLHDESIDQSWRQDIQWGNTLYHARWNHLFSPRLFSNLTLGYTRYRQQDLSYNHSTSYKQDEKLAESLFSSSFGSGIDDFSALLDLDLHLSSRHHIMTGAHYILHKFRPEVKTLTFKSMQSHGSDAGQSGANLSQPANWSHETALYIEDDMSLPRRWQLNAGFRVAAYTTGGKTWPAFEPRLSLCRPLLGGWRAKASYSLMHQYVHKLTTSPITTPNDLWVSVTADFKPMTSHQWVLGASTDHLALGWQLDAELFWKELYDVMEYRDGCQFSGNSLGWQQMVSTGRGRSFGTELHLARTQGRTTGQLSYTWSHSDRWFPDGSINRGRRYPYRYDRRHVLHLSMQHQFTPHVDLNATWHFASGPLTTVAKQQTQYYSPIYGAGITARMQVDRDFYSSRNNYRMAPSHQLDLSLNIRHDTRRGQRTWSFGLINAYCHLNQDMLYTEVKTVTNDQGEREDRRVVKAVTLLPVVPHFSYSYKF